MLIDDLRAAFPTHRTAYVKARGGLRLNRPHVKTARRDRKLAELETDPTLRLLMGSAPERSRITKDVERQITGDLRDAFAASLWPLGEALGHVRDWQAWERTTRRDPLQGPFGRALDGLTNADMIAFRLLELARMPMLKAMSGTELLQAYTDAIHQRNVHLASAYLDAKIIERLVESGGITPANEHDLGASKELREVIAEVQAMRVPANLPDYEGLGTDIARLYSHAKLLQVSAVDPDRNPAAAEAFRQLEGELLEVGTPSDRDDIKAVSAAIGAAQAARPAPSSLDALERQQAARAQAARARAEAQAREAREAAAS